jgi:hypothetical protein
MTGAAVALTALPTQAAAATAPERPNPILSSKGQRI